MYYVLKDFIGTCVYVYMDDIIIFSKSEKRHKLDVKNILMKLAKFGLSINIKKCLFFKDEVNFLGYTIDGNKVIPDFNRFRKALGHREIETEKVLHQELGLLNYFRKFIKNYAAKYRKKGLIGKLESPWIGPFEIVTNERKNVFKIKSLENGCVLSAHACDLLKLGSDVEHVDSILEMNGKTLVREECYSD
ncbi:POL5 [Hepatospora eriocheir]|uniref:POL5 n=1 Tax=Hepatospora eriocheir TaxID=1081669 RepID=A0A1X0QID4_9MICR|nr:POL5 [Hepatospora eriocheir]